MMQSVRLKALDSFRCTGGDCPFTCCQRWNISVEPKTLAAWEALEPGPFKQTLLTSIERKDASGLKSAVMRLGSDGKCVLLDEAGLCRIHKESGGQKLLPDICREYPRINIQYGSRSLMTANMSCPEVARLVLDSQLSGQFAVTTEAIPAPQVGVDFAARIGLILDDFVKHALSEQRFSLVVRISGIAEVLIHLALKAQQGALGLNEVQQLCAKPKQRLYDLNQKIKSQRIRPQAVVAGRFWKFIFMVLKTGGAESFLKDEVTQGEFAQRAMAAQSDDEYEALYAEVLGYRGNAVYELGEPYRTYGDKYLLVKFINSGFPVAPIQGNFIASFLFCLYPYAMIQLCLWLLSARNGKVGDADVLEVIYRVERMLGHSDSIFRYLEQNEAALRLDMYYQCFTDL